MSDINLHMNSGRQVTCVANTFIDEYMKDTPGEYVKIYLYLLRCLGDSRCDFSISRTAEVLGHTQRDVKMALRYLEKNDLLSVNYDDNGDICDICLLAPVSHLDAKEDPVSSFSPKNSAGRMTRESGFKVMKSDYTLHAYSNEELAEFQDNEEFQQLLFIAEKYLGRTLSVTDINYIACWYFEFKLSADLIDYLISSCMDNGKSSLKYMHKVAVSWAEQDISTVEEARSENDNYSHHSAVVRQAMGISGRTLTPAELNYINTWYDKWGFSDEFVAEACSRTILGKGQINFPYANSILKNWYENGIRTREALAAYDNSFNEEMKKKYSKPSSRTPNLRGSRLTGFEMHNDYDIDDIEQRLLKKKIQ